MNMVTRDTVAVPDSSCYPVPSELDYLAGFLDPSLPFSKLTPDGQRLMEGGFPYDCFKQPSFTEMGGCLDSEWMLQNAMFNMPQDQDSDLSCFFPPSLSSSYSHSPLSALPTPESSLPPSPEACLEFADPDLLTCISMITSEDPSPPQDIRPVLSTTHPHPLSPLSSPASYTPSSPLSSSLSPLDTTSSLGCHPPSPPHSYDLSPSSSYTTTSSPLTSEEPYLSPLPPPSSSSQELSPNGANYSFSSLIAASTPPTSPPQDKSPESIRDLLVKTEQQDPVAVGSSEQSLTMAPQKRKTTIDLTGEDGEEGTPTKGKRRKLSRTGKKERKKEQNKQAAFRYRQRKRDEVSCVEEKREELEAVNAELHRQVAALTTEISYLKNLWHEVSEARMRHLH